MCGVVDGEANLAQYEGWLSILFVGGFSKLSGGDRKREGSDPDGVTFDDVF